MKKKWIVARESFENRLNIPNIKKISQLRGALPNKLSPVYLVKVTNNKNISSTTSHHISHRLVSLAMCNVALSLKMLLNCTKKNDLVNIYIKYLEYNGIIFV